MAHWQHWHTLRILQDIRIADRGSEGRHHANTMSMFEKPHGCGPARSQNGWQDGAAKAGLQSTQHRAQNWNQAMMHEACRDQTCHGIRERRQGVPRLLYEIGDKHATATDYSPYNMGFDGTEKDGCRQMLHRDALAMQCYAMRYGKTALFACAACNIITLLVSTAPGVRRGPVRCNQSVLALWWAAWSKLMLLADLTIYITQLWLQDHYRTTQLVIDASHAMSQASWGPMGLHVTGAAPPPWPQATPMQDNHRA